jgi:RNA-directed DNA polymerase
VFLDTSYGFRPGRSCHDALRQLNHEVKREPVNGMVELELAQFFATMPHTAILAVLAERIAAQTFLRLSARLLKAGGQTPGGSVHDARGSPQGSLVAPALAHALWDHVLDQCFGGVVRHDCHGYCNLLRYADDALAVCETADDARRWLRVLPVRRGTCGLRLNPQQTHRVACGQRRAGQVVRGGGRSRSGKARLKRKTSKKRLRRALVERNQWLRQERHVRQLPDLWQAIAQKMQGHCKYFGVTDNSRALINWTAPQGLVLVP